MTSNDEFLRELVNHSVFKALQNNNKSSSGQNIKNSIIFKDDILFVWNADKNCLQTLNLQSMERSNNLQDKYQTLTPLVAPTFEVERLALNATGSRICAWGQHGATVFELPRRWGPDSLFDGGKENILCKSYNLDEPFYMVLADARRVRWHPTSLSHVLVLTSDNTIRIYNMASKVVVEPMKILELGPKPKGKFAGKGLLDSLGDTAVDFDYYNKNCLILRGNGDVYMIDCSLKELEHPPLKGPLTMLPSADDNYGEDACSIMVLEQNSLELPPVVVIATARFVVYHCILLPVSGEQLEELRPKDADYDIIVTGILDLEINLNYIDNPPFFYPLLLYPSVNTWSYLIMHTIGVHRVSLPIVHEMTKCLNAENGEYPLVTQANCKCTLTVRTSPQDSNIEPPSPAPIGIALLPNSPPTLLLITFGGDVIIRTLGLEEIESQIYNETFSNKNKALSEDENTEKVDLKRDYIPFTKIMSDLLSHDETQPLLKISSNKKPDEDALFEYLSQTTERMSSEYVKKQEKAQDIINKKLNNMKNLETQQTEWLAELEVERKELMERYTEHQTKLRIAREKSEHFKKTCNKVLRYSRSNKQELTPSERAYIEELKIYKQKFQSCQDRITELKMKMNYLKQKENQGEDKLQVELNRRKFENISALLKHENDQIGKMIVIAKELRKQMELD